MINNTPEVIIIILVISIMYDYENMTIYTVFIIKFNRLSCICHKLVAVSI